jgi:succinyl-CoA synthetase beta subunit
MVDAVRVLTEPEAVQFLRAYGIPFPPFEVAHSPIEAVEIASAWPEPLVLKVVSREIQHKSDVGGVRLGVLRDEIPAAYDEILATVSRRAPGRLLEGILIQPQAPAGIEVIIGIRRDEAFEHALLLGVGGILSELIEEVSIRLLPVDAADARAMIDETKLGKVLTGIRNTSPGDMSTLCQLVEKLSLVVKENPGIVEMDLNPVIVHPEGVTVVDALVVFESPENLSIGRPCT